MIISTIEIKSCMLLKGEKLFCNKFFNGLDGEKHRKLIQFATCFTLGYILFFKGLIQVLFGKFLMLGLHIPLGFIIWPIKPI